MSANTLYRLIFQSNNISHIAKLLEVQNYSTKNKFALFIAVFFAENCSKLEEMWILQIFFITRTLTVQTAPKSAAWKIIKS